MLSFLRPLAKLMLLTFNNKEEGRKDENERATTTTTTTTTLSVMASNYQRTSTPRATFSYANNSLVPVPHCKHPVHGSYLRGTPSRVPATEHLSLYPSSEMNQLLSRIEQYLSLQPNHENRQVTLQVCTSHALDLSRNWQPAHMPNAH